MPEARQNFSTIGLEPAALPDAVTPDPLVFDQLLGQLRRSHRITVLTGAGCSTESGIPDYRAADGRWKGRQPIQFADFLRSNAMRRRYWARSMVGWPVVASAEPNAAHAALATLERDGPVQRLISQNVDGLHGRAGSRDVIDLHGRLDQVVCMDCSALMSRADYQVRLLDRNPGWQQSGVTAPDGDADLPEDAYEGFRIVDCDRCGGLLKPDVVFFGENVPRPRVEVAFAELDASDCLLVAGSSLMVWSGYRFVRRARARDIPVLIVGLGRTRGDDDASIRLQGRCGDVLPRLARELTKPS